MTIEWNLILFTFFVCASAGVLLMQGLLTVQGKARKMQIESLVLSLALLAIGGIAVFFHLQHWTRMFNGFGHITSGITQELIGVILMGITIVLFFLMVRRSETGQAPKWVALLAIVVPFVMVFLMGHSYLMAARPAWDSFMLVVYYFVQMFLIGALFTLILAAVRKHEDAYDFLIKVALIAAIAQLVVVIAYALLLQSGSFADHGFYFDPTLPDVAVTVPSDIMAGILTGNLALPFWLLAVACGAVVPAILMWLSLRKEDQPNTLRNYAIIALVAAAAGGICWRVILYIVAVTVFAIF